MFVNPHMNQMLTPQQQMQQLQMQQMQQQQMMQQQMMQQQQQMITPEQARQMQEMLNMYQMQQSRNMPRNMPAQPAMTNMTLGSRFNSPNPQQSSNRFGESTMIQTVPQELEAPEVLEINKFQVTNMNDAIKISVKTDPVNRNKIYLLDVKTIVECEYSALESVTEAFHSTNEAKDSVAILQNTILADTYYGIDYNDTLIKAILDDRSDKVINKLYRETTNKNEVVILSSLNSLLTDKINTWLSINTASGVHIDSYMIDYGDLLTHLKTETPEVEDGFINYMQNYREKWKNNYKQYKESTTESSVPSTAILSDRAVVYIDYMASDIGIDKFTSTKPIYIPKKSNNSLIVSLCNFVFTDTDETEFVLTTMDKRHYRFYKSSNAYYISL